jgi:hypothetical protein
MDKEIKELQITDITIDNEIQQRVEMHQAVIKDYYLAMKQGDEFPPIIVYFDGHKYWLSDGFHRVAAAKKIDRLTIKAEIREGGRLDAIKYSLGANAAHGLRRSNACKNKTVVTALTTPGMSTLSNRQIAKLCRVSHALVNKIKNDLESNTITVKAPIEKGDDRRSAFFMECDGLNMERRGEPVFDYGTINKKHELVVQARSHTAGLMIRCHTDELTGIETFELWQTYCKGLKRKEIDWSRSFRLGVMSNDGLDFVFEPCIDNYTGDNNWQDVDRERYFEGKELVQDGVY